MKILVCISKVPDTTAKISFTDNNTAFDTNGVQFIMNPYDEWYALVRAVELTEGGKGETTVINVGPATNDAIIRKGLAIGADKAVRVDAEATSAHVVAQEIANYAKDKGYDLILTGKETIDYNGSELGAMIAEMLNQPYVSYASHMEVAGTTASIKRDIEGGVELLDVDLPAVVSAAKGMAEQRIPNMRGIMMAKRKPLEVVAASAGSGHVAVQSYMLPAAKGSVTLVDPDNMDELVRLLHEEAKVI
ncbi:MAG: electron transfer flavoprotein beta subunit/FixA family protein [Saprospiraceae bacterium]